ncbi:GFA family protein [Wenxinia marina]|uniref:CENP-V/GFA domain-containing protein n=1 Tax=Wenxinia marina DSM 24838 TaxID=1123501 RepID=A0A0D0Q966_9RHOB|nr:GFA family protein [Wenxinia marina]KIQ70969.1 hypothetical protein Wenmar_00345 [Wenxinia marina DSM 24838]GGL55878.1 aldehyde-activating protein [Wenxinia marina]
MTARHGQCLCGAVTFEAAETGGFGVCHCHQCQRWLGGPMLGVTVPEAAMSIEGPVVTRRTSGWASRSRCGECGSPLWYRWDKGADGTGNYEVPIGLLDDANGLTLAREIFIEEKPDCFDLAGEHPRLTWAQLKPQLEASE